MPLKLFLQIMGVYFVIVGTWRLATSTIRKPIGIDIKEIEHRVKEMKYNPLCDLVCPHKIAIWMWSTICTFNKRGEFTDAGIMHKRFNWGLLWLLFGIILQFISQMI